MGAILYKDKVYGAGGGGGGGGATTLDGLNDVAISSPTDGQVLTYDDANDKWINADASGGDESIILTMAEYNALTPEQQTDTTKTYYITDAPGGGGNGLYVIKTLLFEQAYSNTWPTTIALSDAFTNYDILEFDEFKKDDSSYYDFTASEFYSCEVLKAAMDGDISGRTNAIVFQGWEGSGSSSAQYARYRVTNTTTLTKLGARDTWGLRKVYGIKFISPNTYSSSEQVIGTWIDGKPLYQKTVTVPNTSAWSNNSTFNNDVSNADMIWIYDGFIYDNRSTQKFVYPNPMVQNSDRLSFNIDLNDKSKFKVSCNTTYAANADRYAVLTVRYTKTTDTAS